MMTVWQVSFQKGRSARIQRCFFTNPNDAQRWLDSEGKKQKFRNVLGPQRHTMTDGVRSVVTLLNIYC
jgi:hypothetical protein